MAAVRQSRDPSIRMFLLGALIALELLMSFSFLGYLHVEPISITFAYVPVLLAGALLGPAEAAVLAGSSALPACGRHRPAMSWPPTSCSPPL